MGLETFTEALTPHPHLALDSMLFIYLLESSARYEPLVSALFKRIEAGRHAAMTSTLTLTEVLTVPYRDKNLELAEQFRHTLLDFPHLKVMPFDEATAALAASLRAQYAIRTPDAIQLATALEHGATAFITNDKQLAKVQEVKVLVLDEFISTRK